MIENPQTISRAIRLSFISKYLERIADHATNIAELVVYMVEPKLFVTRFLSFLSSWFCQRRLLSRPVFLPVLFLYNFTG